MIALKTWAAILVWAAAQLTTGGSVTGSIRLQGGGPAVGVRVVAIEVPSVARAAAGAQTFARITQTDSNGRYSLEDLAPGRYYIAAGPVSSQTFHPGTPQQNAASVVMVSRDSRAVNGIDFTLSTALPNAPVGNCCVYRGQVVTEDGRPLPTFTTLRVVDKGSTGNPATFISPGLFRIILRGTAQLSIDGLPPGYVLKSQAFGGNPPAAGPVLIDGKAPYSVVLTLGYEPVAQLLFAAESRTSRAS